MVSRRAEICTAADASENAKFVGIVMGWMADIEALHRNVCAELGLKEIHMRRTARRMEVVKGLSAMTTSSVHMYCLRIDRSRLFGMLSSARGTSYRSRRVLHEHLDYCMGIEIKRAVSSSLEFFGRDWSRLTVEVDRDTERPIKMTGLTVAPPGPTHQLADVVAWSNHAGKPVSKVKQADLVVNIERRLRKRLRI